MNLNLDYIKSNCWHELEENKMLMPTNVILNYNWKHCSNFNKLKYLIKYKNIYKTKMNLAIDNKIENILDELNKIKDKVIVPNDYQKKNSFLRQFIKDYNIKLNSPNQDLKRFLLTLYKNNINNEALYYCNFDNLDIFKCYYNEDGHRGRYYREENGDSVILIFTGYYYKLIKNKDHDNPPEELIYDYVRTLVHELAHILIAPLIDNNINSHNKLWTNLMLELGINDIDYLNSMEENDSNG